MKLSEAIRFGRTLRPESHQAGHPFVRVANEDDLRSDPLGAAVEAAHSPIVNRSWTDTTYETDMAVFDELLHRYFDTYFHTSANCPGADPRKYVRAGARMTSSRKGEYVIGSEHEQAIGAITTDCRLVLNLAQFVEHAFYVHNWTTEECAQAIEYYEQGQRVVVAQSFEHYQDESVRRATSAKLTDAAWQRELQRRQHQTGNRVYVH